MANAKERCEEVYLVRVRHNFHTAGQILEIMR